MPSYIWSASHLREISQHVHGICDVYACEFTRGCTQKSVSLFSVIFGPVRDFIKEIETECVRILL